MVAESKKHGDAAKAKPVSNAKAERLAAALRANLKRRKSQARDRAELDHDGSDDSRKTR